MGRICAWCRAVLSRANGSEALVSHAICPACRADLERALARSGLRVATAAVGGPLGP